MTAENPIKIEIRGLTMAYGSFVVMRDISAQIRRGEIFVIMGGSGCGKSTLLRHMIGLKEPAEGEILYDGAPFWKSDEESRQRRLRSFGVLFQGGALWSSMTLAENIGLVLGEYTDYPAAEIRDLARLKLALVGLKGFEDYYPAEISGGMCKRVGLARAIIRNPQIVLYDEPTSGLDPVTSRTIDELIGRMTRDLGVTSVVVTHDLHSALSIGTRIAMLHGGKIIEVSTPAEFIASKRPEVRGFLESQFITKEGSWERVQK